MAATKPTSVEDIPETGDAAPLPVEPVPDEILEEITTAVAAAYEEIKKPGSDPRKSPVSGAALKNLVDAVQSKLRFDEEKKTWRPK